MCTLNSSAMLLLPSLCVALHEPCTCCHGCDDQMMKLTMHASCLGVCTPRVFMQHVHEFHPTYKAKVASEFVTASKEAVAREEGTLMVPVPAPASKQRVGAGSAAVEAAGKGKGGLGKGGSKGGAAVVAGAQAAGGTKSKKGKAQAAGGAGAGEQQGDGQVVQGGKKRKAAADGEKDGGKSGKVSGKGGKAAKDEKHSKKKLAVKQDEEEEEEVEGDGFDVLIKSECCQQTLLCSLSCLCLSAGLLQALQL